MLAGRGGGLRWLANNAAKVRKNPAPAEDTLLFVCNRDGFFKLTAVTCVSQAVFWLFVASIAVDMREEVKTDSVSTAPGERPLASLALRVGMTMASLGFAGTFLFLGFFAPSRFVTSLTLLHGGTALRIGTYTFIGRRTFEVPLSQVSFRNAEMAAFSSSGSFCITGHKLFYMLDGKGGKVTSMGAFHTLCALHP